MSEYRSVGYCLEHATVTEYRKVASEAITIDSRPAEKAYNVLYIGDEILQMQEQSRLGKWALADE